MTFGDEGRRGGRGGGVADLKLQGFIQAVRLHCRCQSISHSRVNTDKLLESLVGLIFPKVFVQNHPSC